MAFSTQQSGIHIAGDCGGTGCTFMAKSPDGGYAEELALAKPGNIRSIGVEGFKDLIREVLVSFEVHHPNQEILSMTLGVAGIETPEDKENVLRATVANGISDELVDPMNDAMLGLKISPYIVGAKASVVSGTGANMALQFEGIDYLSTIGGSWYLGSDYEAGGVGIGIKGFFTALHELQMLTGVHASQLQKGNTISMDELVFTKGSVLLNKMYREIGVSDFSQKYSEIYASQPDGAKVNFFSPLAKVVASAAAEHDPSAISILRSSGNALAELLKLGLSGHNAKGAGASLIGGVITSKGPCRDSFIEALIGSGYQMAFYDFPKTTDLLLATIDHRILRVR